MKIWMYNQQKFVSYTTFKAITEKRCINCDNYLIDYPYCEKRLSCSGYSSFQPLDNRK